MERLKKLKIHLWIFPLLAIALSGWYLKKYYDQKGISITVQFSDAKSLQAGKTKVFYRGVPVGTVSEITISEDGEKAVCKIAMQKTASQFAVEGSKFYLVSPKVGLEGISGLETIISGSYIAVDPGKKDASKKTEFDGGVSPPAPEPEENSSVYILETDHAESITAGDNLFYRGVIIGNVSTTRLTKTAQMVQIVINVRNPYSKLIRTNTVFWKKQGIKADLGLFKSDIRINSLDTIMKGGIELATPNEAGEMAKYGQTFALMMDEPKEREKDKWSPALTFPERKSKAKKKK